MLHRVLVVALAYTKWASAARPLTRTKPAERLKDYGNIEVWPLPAQATFILNAHLDPSTFSVDVHPSGEPFLLELAKRFLPLILYENATGDAPPNSWPAHLDHTARLRGRHL